MTEGVQKSGVTGAALAWTPHPLLPVPERAVLEKALDTEAGRKALLEFYRIRERKIVAAEADPFGYGFELDHWKDADEQLAEFVQLMLVVFGGNRSGKSEWAAKRTVEAAVTYPDGTVLVMDESEQASILKVQKYIWRYLPAEIKALNGERDAFYKVKYSQANGFADQKLVLPNRTELLFLNYSQNHKLYEGLELGFPLFKAGNEHKLEKFLAEWRAKNPGKQPPHNIGSWKDESATPPWLTLIETRLATRRAKAIWTFAPVYGMTAAIKEKVGTTCRTLSSKPAELLEPGKVHVEGCPPGEMPYVQTPGTDGVQGSRVIYFHSILNPFGGYAQIKLLCQSRTTEEVERTAYGYSRDAVARAFPRFGPAHIVKAAHLPAEGTNYKVTDPAGTRNFATIWARVTPGNPSKVYIYRDWPNAQKFGEWAVPSENPNRWDGDPGPAQRGMGLGELGYKQLWRGLEKVLPGRATGETVERDPYRRRLQEQIKEGQAFAREEIYQRFIDSRAGQSSHAASQGSTCLRDRLEEAHLDVKTGELAEDGEPMFFELASGERVELGISAVNELLDYDKSKPFCAVTNSPRMFVCEDCKQVIWAMSNWTWEDGEKGACKDFCDDVRYLAEGVTNDTIVYVRPGAMRVAEGWGGY